MSIDEFKSIQKYLNISDIVVAKILKIKLIEIRNWKRIVPAKYSKIIIKILSDFQTVLYRYLIQLKNISFGNNHYELIYFKDKDLLFANHNLFEVFKCTEIWLSFLTHIFREIKKYDNEFEVIIFEKNNYQLWLKINKYCHCDSHLDEWCKSIAHNSFPFSQWESMSILFNESCQDIKLLKKLLPNRINYIPSNNLIKKIDLFCNALSANILDLAKNILNNYKQQRFHNAVILARALYERSVTLWYLEQLLIERLNHNVNDHQLERLMLGSKDGVGINNPIHILNILEKFEKTINSKFKNLYSALSNLVHPNYEAILGSYFIFDFEKKNGFFSHQDNGSIGITILTCLNLSLILTIACYKEIQKLLIKLK